MKTIIGIDELVKYITQIRSGYFDCFMGHPVKFNTAKQIRKIIMSELHFNPEFGFKLADFVWAFHVFMCDQPLPQESEENDD